MYRTVLALARAAPPAGTFGDDLTQLAGGGGGGETAFSELRRACMVRAGRWTYVHDPEAGGAQELYDLEQDPDELRNLARDPQYRGVRAELQERLLDWLIGTEARDLERWPEWMGSADPAP